MRRAARSFWALAFLLLVPFASAAEEVAGLPLHVRHLDSKTVRLSVGDFVSTTNVVAFATASSAG